MKKTLAILMALAMVFCFAACGETNNDDQKSEQPTGTKVYVSIANAGEIKLAAEEIYVNDTNEDGKINVDEVLMQAHEQKCAEGANAYKSSDQGYGLSVETLWGETNGGSYGTYVNNVGVISLEDTVTEGDYVYSYSYSDLSTWSDQYSYFDDFAITSENGEITLHLTSLGIDENWNTVMTNVEGADIIVGGKTYGQTDANGNATITLAGSGEYTVTAKSETQVLVPAICNVIVK